MTRSRPRIFGTHSFYREPPCIGWCIFKVTALSQLRGGRSYFHLIIKVCMANFLTAWKRFVGRWNHWKVDLKSIQQSDFYRIRTERFGLVECSHLDLIHSLSFDRICLNLTSYDSSCFGDSPKQVLRNPTQSNLVCYFHRRYSSTNYVVHLGFWGFVLFRTGSDHKTGPRISQRNPTWVWNSKPHYTTHCNHVYDKCSTLTSEAVLDSVFHVLTTFPCYDFLRLIGLTYLSGFQQARYH